MRIPDCFWYRLRHQYQLVRESGKMLNRRVDVENILLNVAAGKRELLTREEVCQFLNITKTTLWKLTKKGKYKSYGVGNRILYKKSELLSALTPINH